jgi:2-polyprenyl-3-methyl-5-hydroxy-6-metoxy-1,4-benzoquinol methylase
MPSREDIYKAYISYPTHQVVAAPKSPAKKIIFASRRAYVERKFGYAPRNSNLLLSWIARLHPGFPGEVEDYCMFLEAPKPGTKLLEVGCGNGRTLVGLRSLGWQVEGVDVDPVALQMANSQGLETRCGHLLDLKYSADSFDVIIMHHVIEHLHDPIKFLQECHRLLKPGGRLLMITPNMESLGHRLFGANWYPLDPPRHLYLYSRKSMTDLLMRSKFTSAEVSSLSRGARCYFTLSREIHTHRKTDPAYLGTVGQRIIALFYQAALRAVMLCQRDRGEELRAIGRKGDASPS